MPNVPSAPTRVQSLETSIEVQWTAPSTSDLTVTGYILNVDDGNNMDLAPVYIGTNRADILRYTVGSLTTGLPYRFSVQAMNENGNSTQSPIATFYACKSPSGFVTPRYHSSD